MQRSLQQPGTVQARTVQTCGQPAPGGGSREGAALERRAGACNRFCVVPRSSLPCGGSWLPASWGWRQAWRPGWRPA